MYKVLVAGAMGLLLVVNFPAIAAKKKRRFPHGCKAVGVEMQGDAMLLKPVSEEPVLQTIYLMRNISHYPVRLASEKLPDQFYAPKLERRIDDYDWAALSVSDSLLKFNCTSMSGEQVNCGQALEICQYPRAKFAEHNGGTYWVGENGTRKHTIREVIKHGILLRW